MTVTREAGAESCPDLERLSRQVVQLTSGGRFSGSGYAVTFSRTPSGLQASIRRSGSSERVLEDEGLDCRALEQATAITIALLSDAEQTEAESAPPPKKPTKKSPPKPRPREPERQERTSGPARTWILAAEGAALLGVVRPIAPAFAGEVGVAGGRFRAHLGALFVPSQTLHLGPGTLHETLLSGVARGCVMATRVASLRFDLCSGGYLGQTRIEAKGYTLNNSARRMWLTIPIELSLVHMTRHSFVELGISALIPVRSTDFSIDGLGTAYRSLPIGGLVALRFGYPWRH